MCVTPTEFQSRIGPYAQYCPVSLDNSGELVDCSSDTSTDLVAVYRGLYYKFGSEENLQKFLAVPSKYTPPLALAKLPPEVDLPARRSATFVKEAFPKKLELQGYCPVSYLDGKLRYVLFNLDIYKYTDLQIRCIYVFMHFCACKPCMQPYII